MTIAGVSRGRNFNPDELRQLCRSYLAILQDECKGSRQKKDAFWERIADDYNTNKDPKYAIRSAKSLETKTADVREDCTKYKGCVQQILALDYSGDSLEDTYEKARDLFKKKSESLKVGKEGFVYSCCYDIMEKDPRLGVPPDAGSKGKKSKKVTTSSDIPGGNHENFSSPSPGLFGGDIDALHSDALKMTGDIRPMGNKAAKVRKRQLKMDESSQRIAADAHKRMADTAAERLKVVESQSLMMLLTMPGFETDPETLEFLRASRVAEIERLKKRLTVPGDSLPPGKSTRSTNDSPSTHQAASSPSEPDGSEQGAEFQEDSPVIAMRSSLPVPQFGFEAVDEAIITV